MTTLIEKRYALLLIGGINSWNNFQRITAPFSLPSSMRQLMIFNQSILSTLTLLASGKH